MKTNGDNTGTPVAKRFLDKAEIPAQDDLKAEDVFIPEWNAWVRIRPLRDIGHISIRIGRHSEDDE